MQIIKLTKFNHQKIINLSLKILQRGGLIIYPTETCYGAGVDPTNQIAVNKLLSYKQKRQGKPMAVAVYDQTMAQQYVKLSAQARNFYRNFLPGPFCIISDILKPTINNRNLADLNNQLDSVKSKIVLTNQSSVCHHEFISDNNYANNEKFKKSCLILPKNMTNQSIVKGVKSEFNTLGVRIPSYPFILNLIKQFNKPITTTSANASYKKTPYCIDDILINLSKKQKNLIDLIIDAGILPKNPTSLIIDTTTSSPLLIRSSSNQLGKKITSDKTQLKKQKNFLFLTPQKEQIFITKNENETQNLAQRLMLKFFTQYEKKGLVFGLDGELGSGKTIFSKGIAKFLKLKDNIQSPTYTYMHEYHYHRDQNNGFFYHLDVWKINQKQQYDWLKIEKFFLPKNVVAIEWFANIESFFHSNSLLIKIQFTNENSNHRIIKISLPNQIDNF